MKTLSFDRAAIAAVLVLLAPPLGGSAAAQALPAEALTFGGGRITIGGDVSASFSCTDSAIAESRVCADDTGFFNYTDYEHSMLRMLRFDLSASVRATDRLSVLAEVRSESNFSSELLNDIGRVRPYALYARYRPWKTRPFDVQIGRVPPTFGAFARRTYPTDNPLVGYPLAYQYLTSLRPDALPANADELIRMRGRGWLSSFSVGDPTADRGLPLVSAFRWDTGVQLHTATESIDAAVSVTNGSPANPLVTDDNAGKQIAGRFAFTPAAGLVVGASAARAPYVTRDAARLAGAEPSNGGFTQTAFGADLEYSRHYYLVRFETIVSNWRVPLLGAPAIDLPLRSVSTLVEGRYKIRPGLYAAARVDHLGFSTVAGTTRRTEWDAPVTRVELGGGYSIVRNLLLKASFQHNTRPAGRTTRLNLLATQLVFWF